MPAPDKNASALRNSRMRHLSWSVSLTRSHPGAAFPLCPPSSLIYNASVIPLARACMAAMIWLFLVGSAGSLLVVIISFVEDLVELVGKD
jgi:hypothetical protein